VNFQVAMLGLLYALAIYSMWRDRKSVLPTELKPLRRRYLMNAGFVAVVILVFGWEAVFEFPTKWGKNSDKLFAGYLLLQGVRAFFQARREREAWNLAAVREIMES